MTFLWHYSGLCKIILVIITLLKTLKAWLVTWIIVQSSFWNEHKKTNDFQKHSKAFLLDLLFLWKLNIKQCSSLNPSCKSNAQHTMCAVFVYYHGAVKSGFPDPVFALVYPRCFVVYTSGCYKQSAMSVTALIGRKTLSNPRQLDCFTAIPSFMYHFLFWTASREVKTSSAFEEIHRRPCCFHVYQFEVKNRSTVV